MTNTARDRAEEVGRAVRSWWVATHPTAPGSPSRRGVVAELRRKSIGEIALTPTFVAIANDLRLEPAELRRLAIVLHAAAHVREDTGAQGPGVATSLAHGTGKGPALSPLRFRALLATGDDVSLDREAVRIARLLSTANVQDLAASLFAWDEDVRREWARDYYTNLPKDILTELVK